MRTFAELSVDLKSMLDSWLTDETIIDQFQGDGEAIKKEFINTVQSVVGLDYVILTKDELGKQLESYHSSMEGYDY